MAHSVSYGIVKPRDVPQILIYKKQPLRQNGKQKRNI